MGSKGPKSGSVPRRLLDFLYDNKFGVSLKRVPDDGVSYAGHIVKIDTPVEKRRYFLEAIYHKQGDNGWEDLPDKQYIDLSGAEKGNILNITVATDGEMPDL